MSESELKQEIRRIMPERNKLLEQLAAIDRRILELAGIEQDKATKKPPVEGWCPNLRLPP